MANYTTKLRTLCEYYAGLAYEGDYSDIHAVIDEAIPKIFDFDFPIWDNAYRYALERKIVLHYLNYEIGQEVPSLFKLDLETTLNEIMPYYNELYKTTILDFNPLYSVDYTITLERKYTGEDKQDETTHSEGATTDREKDTLARSDTENVAGKDKSVRTDELKEETASNRKSEGEKNTSGKSDTQEDVTKRGTSSETVGISEETSGKTTETGSDSRKTTESEEHSDRGTGSKNGTYAGHSTERFSDTPQGSLAGMGNQYDSNGNLISSDMWLTNATIKDKSETTQESTTDSRSGNSSGTKTETGSDSKTTEVSNDVDTSKTTTGSTSETIGDTTAKTESGKETAEETESESGTKENTGTQTVDGEESRKTDYSRSDTANKDASGTSVDDGTKNKVGSYTKTDDYIRHVIGKDNKTDYGDLINKLRSAIINIDTMVIKDLAPCFMQIW